MWTFPPEPLSFSVEPPTYHWCRVKLRDDVMEENCEVSRPRFQQVNALEGAAFSVDLRQEDTPEASAHL